MLRCILIKEILNFLNTVGLPEAGPGFCIFGNGIRNKAAVIAATSTECKVKSFSLSNFQFVMLNKDAVLMTYTALQDAVCGGTTNAPKVQASVNYVKRGGKWLEAFYTETPITQ